MTCYKRPSLSSVWSECMKGGVTVSVHHILTHSASTKITESHSASILTPTQPQSNLLSPPYQARLGLLDTTPNHIWHLGNVSFFTAYMILSLLTLDCHIMSLLVWYLRHEIGKLPHPSTSAWSYQRSAWPVATLSGWPGGQVGWKVFASAAWSVVVSCPTR